MQFIGRRDWLARFAAKRDAESGSIWNIVGQPGIGKTTLLAEFAQRCEALEHPYIWLDVGNYAPTHGLETLAELVRNPHHFDADADGKSFSEKFNDAFQRHKETLSGAAELAAKVFDPTGVVGGAVKSAASLTSSLAGGAAKSAEREAAARPELFHVKALAAEGKKKPVLLVDTWEHLMRPDAKLKTRLHFGVGNPSEATERSKELAGWLKELFAYLASQGWRIVVAGREIPGATADNRLPRFTRAEILEAARNRPKLTAALEEQQDDIAAILATLSFEGNPLWLQIALNLLENLLDEGKDPAQLASDPDALQRCFEEDDPFDTGKYEGIEHGRCKLALLGTLTRHIEGIEDHAWKIALPRVLDKGIIEQLFTPEQAYAVRHNFQIAGVFRKSGGQFSLHEEIRDLLLAYARDHDFLENAETLELHEKLWVYLNELYRGKLPLMLRAQVSRYGLGGTSHEEKAEIEKQIARHIPLAWMLEATYHRVIGSSVLREMGMVPELFWEKLAGSLSLSNLEKWLVGEWMPDLDFFQIISLVEVFEDETEKFEKLLLEHEHVDPQSYQAWRKQSAREGGGDIHAMYSDVPFWQRRLEQAPTPRNLYCLARALDQCERWKEEVSAWDYLLAQFGKLDSPEIQVMCAKALVNKGWTLGNRLDDPRGAVAAYDDLLTHYGESDNPEIQVQCANALFNKGVTLDNRLDDPRGAAAVYDDLLAHYRDSDNPEIQVLCAQALFNKGWTLGKRLDDPCGAVAIYDDLLARYGESDNPEIQEPCAKALLNKTGTLERLNDLRGAVATCDALLARYGESDNAEIQAHCLSALANSVEGMLILGEPDEAVRRAELALARLEASAPKAAIMVFLRWLARGEAAPDEVLAAIRALPEEPEFGWGWDGIRSLVEALPAPRRCRAECFIAYFETHRDVARLQDSLAGCGP